MFYVHPKWMCFSFLACTLLEEMGAAATVRLISANIHEPPLIPRVCDGGLKWAGGDEMVNMNLRPFSAIELGGSNAQSSFQGLPTPIPTTPEKRV